MMNGFLQAVRRLRFGIGHFFRWQRCCGADAPVRTKRTRTSLAKSPGIPTPRHKDIFSVPYPVSPEVGGASSAMTRRA